MTWAVGQKIVEVTHTWSRPPKPIIHEGVIEKIGKRWAAYRIGSNRASRFDMDDGEIDGGEYASPGRVYADMAAYEEALARAEALDELRQLIGYGRDRLAPTLKAADVRAFIALAKGPDE
jgi:hypothetical protein